MSPATQAFWAELERDPLAVPGALRALAMGHVTVSCGDAEARAALRWARSRPRWSQQTPAIALEPAWASAP